MIAFMLMHLAVADIAQAMQCGSDVVTRFEREADLPKGVLSAFGAPLAERDQPFQSTDIVSTPRLPIYRFIHAERRGCELRLTYEHGGYGYGLDQALLVIDESGWRRINRLTYEKR